MRPDVKLGIVSSMMIVLVAGGYYLYRDNPDGAIPVAKGTVATGNKVTPTKRVANKSSQPNASKIHPRKNTTKRRPSLATGKPSKRSAKKINTTTSTPNQRVAHNNTNRKPLVNKRNSGRATVPIRKTTKLSSKPRTSTIKKTLPTNRVVTNLSRKKNIRRPITGANGLRSSKVSSIQGKTDEAVERHRVQPGDTMATLAINYYGDKKYTQFLIGSNTQLSNPAQLRVGTTVLIPSRPKDPTLLAATRRPITTTHNKPRAKQKHARTYTVKSGDSFYSIARDVLGDAAKWQQLFELNKTIVKGDARKLQIGQVIKLPAS